MSTLKDALWRKRAAAIPEIPPPITITDGDELRGLPKRGGKMPSQVRERSKLSSTDEIIRISNMMDMNIKFFFYTSTLPTK